MYDSVYVFASGLMAASMEGPELKIRYKSASGAYTVKGQCHEIFDHYFSCLKDLTWAPYEQATAKKFDRSTKFENRVSACQRLRGHKIFSLDMEVFIFLNLSENQQLIIKVNYI